MNILFVGPYKQRDELGRKSRALLDALKRTGNTITSRPIFFGSMGWSYTEDAEYTAPKTYDIVVQNVSPAFTVYNGRFKKNIGVFNTDTIDTSPCSIAISRMKLLDEVWVENKDVCKGLQNATGTTNVALIKPYADPSLQGSFSEDDLARNFPQGLIRNTAYRDKFIFYAMGSFSEIEGVQELFCAYFSEFSFHDNCALIYVLENHSDSSHINSFVDNCYKRLGALRPDAQRPLIHIMNPDASGLTVEARLMLHKEADCFICPDYSLNCNSLILEAVYAQNTPIINKNTAAYDLLGESSSWGVDSYEERCMLGKRSFDDTFTSNETCVKPIVKSLSQSMREAYTNKFLREKKRAHNIETTQMFSSDAYYESLKELLCS
jgi:hypothetical protein